MSTQSLMFFVAVFAASSLGCNGQLKLHRKTTSTAEQSAEAAQAPQAPGKALTFALNDKIGIFGIATWEAAGAEADGSAIAKQQFLLYADGDTTCARDPVAIHDIEGTATTFQWDRLISDLPGTLRFRVRSMSKNGLSKDSDCSGEIALRNGPGIVPGTVANLKLGSTAKLADVTGDGIDDVIVSSVTFNSNRGYIAILPGGENPAKNLLRVYEGTITTDSLGKNLAVLDLNKDGINDIISSNEFADPSGLTSAGSIFVILGSKNLPASGSIESVGKRYDGAAAGDQFGANLHTGDFNGDGYIDMISASSTALAGDGSIYVVPGSANMAASGTIAVVGYRYDGTNGGGEALGYSIGIEDITGDGKAEILASSPSSSVGFALAGAIIVIPGATSFPASGFINTVAQRYNGGAAADQIGAGTYLHLYTSDITGDGLKDIVAAGDSLNRAIAIVTGQNTMPASGTIGVVVGTRRYTSAIAGEQFEIFPANFADVTGDAVNDLIYPTTQNAYVLVGGALPANGTMSAQWRRYSGLSNAGTAPYKQYCDVTGDGIKDILISDSLAAGGGAQRGSLFVIQGGVMPASNTISTVALRRYDGDSNSDNLRFETCLDVTGDGVLDMLGASPLADPGGVTDAGAIYVIPGSTNLPATGLASSAGRRYTGTLTNDKLGLGNNFFDVDLNNDGVRDIASGNSSAAPNSKAGAGSVFVVLGSSSLPASADITSAGLRFDGSVAGQALGAVQLEQSPVVDINRDGYADLVFGHASPANAGINVVMGGKQVSAANLKSLASTSFGDPAYIGFNTLYADITGDNKKDLISFGINGASVASFNNLTDAGAIYFISGALLP